LGKSLSTQTFHHGDSTIMVNHSTGPKWYRAAATSAIAMATLLGGPALAQAGAQPAAPEAEQTVD
jgi:hypothetical protein